MTVQLTIFIAEMLQKSLQHQAAKCWKLSSQTSADPLGSS